MSPKPIDYEYYEWLVHQIDIPNGKRYDSLFEHMHNQEFFWTVPNDDNRLQDGLDLRYEFAGDDHRRLLPKPASFLEVLVALSRRTAFTASGKPEKWAWRLLKNLRLTKMSDPLTLEQGERMGDILYSVIWRTYEPNGRGGFFPLKYSAEDQTKVEIWYQMNKYVIEMHGP